MADDGEHGLLGVKCVGCYGLRKVRSAHWARDARAEDSVAVAAAIAGALADGRLLDDALERSRCSARTRRSGVSHSDGSPAGVHAAGHVREDAVELPLNQSPALATGQTRAPTRQQVCFGRWGEVQASSYQITASRFLGHKVAVRSGWEARYTMAVTLSSIWGAVGCYWAAGSTTGDSRCSR